MTNKIPFKALLLDHDDTAVDSTAKLHYPSYISFMKKIRPDYKPLSLENWFIKSFSPGVHKFFEKELKLSPTELQEEHSFWQKFCQQRIPGFFDGIPEILKDFRKSGGIIAVISHSLPDIIERDYSSIDFYPDMIFGWNSENTKMKPHPWPAQQVLQKFNIKASEALIVDDLQYGIIMGRKLEIPVAWAGWCHNIPSIKSYMIKNSVQILESREELRKLLFGEIY